MLYEQPVGYKISSKVKAAIESVAYYPFHLHKDDVEVICVLNGEITISDSALDHDLSYGDVYIFNSNDPHKIISNDTENILLTIQFDKRYYGRFFSDLEDAYFICDSFATKDFHNIELKHLRFLAAKLYDCYSREKVSEHEIEQYTKDMIGFLLKHFQHYTYERDGRGKIKIVRIQKYDQTYKDYERMYRIVDHVSVHYREKLTLAEMAEREYLTPSYLSKYIKRTLGLSFSELVSLTRCEEAERLLSSSKKTIDQIARDAGFSNRQHLAAQFKKWFQRTPTQYRRSIASDLDSKSKAEYQPFDHGQARIFINMYLDGY